MKLRSTRTLLAIGLTAVVGGAVALLATGTAQAATATATFARSCWNVVAPPRPKLVPRPGTVAECQMRAWFSI